MKFGLSIPNFGAYFNPRDAASLAAEAEAHGWDGFFVWDHMLFWRNMRVPVADPWVSLAAVALATERIRIGPMVTPLARRRPWKVARETVTLDHLSGGRLTLGVGLGFPPDAEFGTFGEDVDDRVRAQKLDEGLAILEGAWSGEPFGYRGKHYRLLEDTYLPRPVQQPRIPIWVAAMWPNMAPFRRAAKHDGVFVIDGATGGAALEPEQLAESLAHLAALRGNLDGYDVVASLAAGREPGAYEKAGATWLIQGPPGFDSTLEDMRAVIRNGPPR
ncbi:MAG: LLM class flavin-dependent oxidoreductase [Dehalococcoidia bacterium]